MTAPENEDERQRILRDLIGALERHPIVKEARGYPPSSFTEVRAELAPERWGYIVDQATVRMRWYPDTCPQFVFHYSDSTGFDCGWHCEPNPHVDQWSHYQERECDSDEYVYEAITFEANTPPTITWELTERLKGRLTRDL